MEELRHTLTHLIFVMALLLTCVCGVKIEFNNQSKQANTLIENTSNVRLTCVLTNLSTSVYWYINGNVQSFCLVNEDRCYPDTSDSGLYKYSSNRSRKEYYLTIPTVPFDPARYRSTEFKCMQNVTSAAVNLTIAKVEDSNPIMTYNNITRVVTAVTDCVYPATGIKMKWFYCQDNVETPLPDSFIATTNTDSKGCSGKGDAKVYAYLRYNEVVGGQRVELKIVVSNAAGRIGTADTFYRLTGTTFMIEVAVGTTTCTTTADCGRISNVVCSTDGICVCTNGYKETTATSYTCEAVTVDTTTCTTTEDCGRISNVVCSTDRVCVCTYGYKGTSASSNTCEAAMDDDQKVTEANANIGAIVGATIGGNAIVLVVISVLCWSHRQRGTPSRSNEETETANIKGDGLRKSPAIGYIKEDTVQSSGHSDTKAANSEQSNTNSYTNAANSEHSNTNAENSEPFDNGSDMYE